MMGIDTSSTTTSGGARARGLERLGTVADGDDVVALEPERPHERLTYGAVVLRQQQRVRAIGQPVCQRR